MRFCWSTLDVVDMDESIRFYSELLGLDMVSRFKIDSGLEIAFLGSGETKVELICDGTKRGISIGNGISWGFEVTSLDSALALIKESGIVIESGPTQPTPKTRYFFVRDPNGLRIQIVENQQ